MSRERLIIRLGRRLSGVALRGPLGRANTGLRRACAGFSVVEILLAATVFGFLVTALSGAVIYGRSGTATAGERLQALALAEEGLEAVRNMRDFNFTELDDGNHGLAQTGSPAVWDFSGTSDTTGIFNRQITVSTVDSTRKAIVATVSWTHGGVSRQVTATTRLTNWKAAIIPPPPTTGPIMMAYSKTTTTPSYRIWNGTAWGAEANASAVNGNINYVVLKSSATRNEAILGTQTSAGAIYVQFWDGTSWSVATQLAGSATTATRSFDIAYEKNSGRAIIAYSTSSGSADFAYQIWDGTNLVPGGTITASPTTGAINWIELRQNPLSSSNEIAMIMVDSTTAVYGMRWTGSAWNNMGTSAIWDTATASATLKAIDVEYEQTSGEAMFIWGDSVATDLRYRTWNGTTLSSATLLDISTAGVANMVQLAARPGNNEIMLGVQDSLSDLNTRVWSGSGWDTGTQHPEHDASLENATSRNFDIVWETHASNLGKAWLVWGDGAKVSKRQWTSGASTPWDPTVSLLLATGTDDTSFIRLRADASSGAVFAGLYESQASSADDIWESHLTSGGAAWSARNTIWIGQTSAEPVYFRIDIATP